MKRQRSGQSSAHTGFAAAVLLSVASVMPAAAEERVVPAGGAEQIDKPVHRFDIRLENQHQSGGVDAWTTTLRYQRPFNLGDGWEFTYRVDVPLPVNNDNSAHVFRVGVGDTLLQATLSRTLEGGNGFGVALRMIAPTASGEAFGGGRWRLLPSAAYRLGLPAISSGSYFQPTVRYQFDFAGDPARNHYSDLQFAPSLNIELPRDWYVTLFPSTDFRYNFIRKEWFVPFNIEVGKQWSKAVVSSLEFGMPVYREANPIYLFKLEGRLTVLF